jgi:hypothetical protein
MGYYTHDDGIGKRSIPEPEVYNLTEVDETLAAGVDSFVRQYEGIADWEHESS